MHGRRLSRSAGSDFALADAPQGHLTGKLIDARSGKALAGADRAGLCDGAGQRVHTVVHDERGGRHLRPRALPRRLHGVWYYKRRLRSGSTTTAPRQGPWTGNAALPFTRQPTVTQGGGCGRGRCRAARDRRVRAGRKDVDDDALQRHRPSGCSTPATATSVRLAVASDAKGELQAWTSTTGSAAAYKVRCHARLRGRARDEYFSFTARWRAPLRQTCSRRNFGVSTPGTDPDHSARPPARSTSSGRTLDAHGLPVAGVTVRVDGIALGRRLPGHQRRRRRLRREPPGRRCDARFTVSLPAAAVQPGTYLRSGLQPGEAQPDEPGDRSPVAPGPDRHGRLLLCLGAVPSPAR